MKRIAIIAGETSGDILGGRLIQSIKKQHPDIQFEGIAGDEMLKSGCKSLYPMERLAVMGFAEVFSRLFELLKIRKSLIQRWIESPPDLFIGIDAPDFNLKLEEKLHAHGIKTIHYVSPSVWAWREKRVEKMKGNIDKVLTLFPFEVDFYNKHSIDAEFVGHPLADEIPLQIDQKNARDILNLPQDRIIIALLPGSRSGEIQRLASDFLHAAKSLYEKDFQLCFVTPVVNAKIEKQFLEIKQSIAPDLSITLVQKQSRTVMMAADYILLASGTAVLEGMLVGRPMVAAYRVSAMTAFIIRAFKMMKVKYFTLPNNLSGEMLVSELIQEEVTSENIVRELEDLMVQNSERTAYVQQRFHEIHQELRCDASERAAQAVLKLLPEYKSMEQV